MYTYATNVHRSALSALAIDAECAQAHRCAGRAFHALGRQEQALTLTLTLPLPLPHLPRTFLLHKQTHLL